MELIYLQQFNYMLKMYASKIYYCTNQFCDTSFSIINKFTLKASVLLPSAAFVSLYMLHIINILRISLHQV